MDENPESLIERRAVRDQLWLDYKRLQDDADRIRQRALAAHEKWVAYYLAGRDDGLWK